LEAYRKFVADRAAAADGELFFNRSADHAAIVIEYLFRGAASEVNILTGELFKPVYAKPAVVEAAVGFLRDHPDATIRIVAERPIPESHPMLIGLARAGLRHRTTIKVLDPASASTLTVHFAVADGRAFRLEPNKKLMEAVIQFGAPQTGDRLNDLFHKIS
jgi:hypothetical protein